MKTVIYSEDFKDYFRDTMEDILFSLFHEAKPFKIYIKNFNNWDKPLPEPIKNSDIIELDIKGEIFKYCEIIDDKLELNLMFGDNLYHKKLDMYELVAIFDADNIPILYKPFEDLNLEIDDYKVIYDKKKGIIQSLIDNTVMVI